MNLVLESQIVTSNDVSTILFTLYNICTHNMREICTVQRGAQRNVLFAIIKFEPEVHTSIPSYLPNTFSLNLSICTTASAQVCYLMLRLSSLLVKMVCSRVGSLLCLTNRIRICRSLKWQFMMNKKRPTTYYQTNYYVPTKIICNLRIPNCGAICYCS